MIINKDHELQNGSSDGSSSVVIPVNNKVTDTVITINGLGSGTATIRAKADGGDSFESIDGGSLSLSTNRTLLISDFQLDEVEISVSPSAAYDYRIEQR